MEPMPTFEIVVRIVAGILLTLANAFFVLVEFSLTRLRQFDEDEIMGEKGLERAWKMTEKLEVYLTGCQLGITSTSILLGVVFEPAVTVAITPLVEVFGASGTTARTISIVSSVVLINLVHKIWGEQIPTYLGIEKPKEVARLLAPAHYWWTKIMYPLIILGDGAAKQTLRLGGVRISRSWAKKAEGEEAQKASSPRSDLRTEMVNLLKTTEELPEDRKEEVLKTLELEWIPVSKIMIPAEEICWLSADSSFEENMKVIEQSMLSRYPLRDDRKDGYVGNIYATKLLMQYDDLKSGNMALRDIVSGQMKITQDTAVSDLIDAFQENDQELAMVTDNGKIVGLVTLTMALEAIVGEARDPLDRESGQA